MLSFVLQDVLTSVSAVTSTADTEAAAMVEELMTSGWPVMVSSIGSYLMLGVTALPLMFAGTVLMKKKGEKVENKHVIAVFVTAGVMFFVGLAMVIGASVYLVVSQGIGM